VRKIATRPSLRKSRVEHLEDPSNISARHQPTWAEAQRSRPSMPPRSGSGTQPSLRMWRKARGRYCRGYCDPDGSGRCHEQRVDDLCDAHLPHPLAKIVTESSRYQEFVRHFQKTGQAERCDCGCIVNISDDVFDCLCAFDACAYEALARAAAEGQMPRARQPFSPQAPSAASCQHEPSRAPPRFGAR